MSSINSLSKPDWSNRFVPSKLQRNIMVSIIGFAQGLISPSDLALSYICRDVYRLSPAKSSFFTISGKIPWTFKPLWGVISDNVHLVGYRRKSYLILMAVVGWMSLLNFGLWLPPLGLAFILSLLNNFSLSFEACIAQALLVENTQEESISHKQIEEGNGKAASRGVSAFIGARYLGSMLGALIIIYLFKETRCQEFMLGISLVPLLVFFSAFFLQEKRKAEGDQLIPNKQSTEIIEMESYVPSFNKITEEEKPREPSTFAKTMAFMRDPYVHKVMLLLFFSEISPYAPQTKFYYYTLYLGFTPSFLGSMSLIAISAILLATFVYNKWLGNLDIKKFYYVTLLLTFLLKLSQLILLFRVNLAFGLPDQVFVALDTFAIEMAGGFNSLPLLVLTCKICPKDIEATTFALFVSIINLGSLLSLQCGALLTYLLGITSENFDNLWILVLLNAILGLLPLTILFNIQTENTINQSEETQKNDYTIESKMEIPREQNNSIRGNITTKLTFK